MRSGSRTLSLFTNALNARVLDAHTGGSLRPSELDETLGWAPQSSLRAAVRKLREVGALAPVEPEEGQPSTATELTAAGHELLPVAAALEHWLRGAPDGPIPLDDSAARGTIRVLTAGWDSTIVRTLAERPLSLIDLNSAISGLNYPALKRRLGKLRSTHLVTPVPTGNTHVYETTAWLRRAIVPLILAGRWERRHDAGAEPVSRVEVEAAFLLSLPLIRVPARASGACALAVLTSDDGSRSKKHVAGVTVEVEHGRLASFHTGTAAAQATWALGGIDAWLDAVIDGNREPLRFSGAKPRLAENVVKALHTGLFPSPSETNRLDAEGAAS